MRSIPDERCHSSRALNAARESSRRRRSARNHSFSTIRDRSMTVNSNRPNAALSSRNAHEAEADGSERSVISRRHLPSVTGKRRNRALVSSVNVIVPLRDQSLKHRSVAPLRDGGAARLMGGAGVIEAARGMRMA